MTADTDLAGLYRAVKAGMRRRPADRTVWLVLADALDEAGQADLATAWRWLARGDRWPEKSRDGWTWYNHGYHGRRFAGVECMAPYEKDPHGWYGFHKTVFDAFDALARDLAKFRPKEVYGE